MKQKLRDLLSVILICLMSIQLLACGDTEKENIAEFKRKDYIYVPEYFEIEKGEYIDCFCPDEKGFYYKIIESQEGTEEIQEKIKYFDVATGNSSDSLFTFKTNDKDGSYGNIQFIELSADKKEFILLKNKFEVTDLDSYSGKNIYSIMRVSIENGTVIDEVEITEMLGLSDGNTYIENMLVDKDNNLYLTDNNGIILIFNQEMEKQFEIEINGSWIFAIGRTKEGQIVYIDDGQAESGFELNVIDPTQKTISKTCTKDIPYAYGNGKMFQGFETGVILNDEHGLVEYDIENEIATPIMDWVDSDIYSNRVSSSCVLEDGRILAILSDYKGDTLKNEVAVLKKTPASEMEEKEVITLGVLYQSEDVNRAVVEFNKKSDKYRVELIIYRENPEINDNSDWEADQIRFNNDIAAGNGTDIYDLNGLNIEMLAQKEVLEDLFPYLEKDEELSKEDYFPSVINAFSIDDKLYSIPSFVRVQTLFGKSSEVGNESGWTLDELMATMEGKPEGTEVLEYGTKDLVLQMCLNFDLDSYIDWSTGECKFNSEEFLKVLEFANQFPKEFDFEEELDTVSKIQSGKLLLLNHGLNTVQDYQMILGMMGEPVTAIGYPVAEGVGAAFVPQNLYGINANSEHKEGAWEFIKSLIGPEFYEEQYVWGFPTLISAYDKMNEEFMTPNYYEDINGNQVEESKGSFGYDGYAIEIYAANQEEVDAVTNIINDCDKVFTYDLNLYNIIAEETTPFFEGQKSAKEVANIIQSRVQMYVNENR